MSSPFPANDAVPSAPLLYTWQSGDVLTWVASDHLEASGFPTIDLYLGAIMATNPSVVFWWLVTAGTILALPYWYPS